MKYTINKLFILISTVIGIVLGFVFEFLYREEILSFGSRIPIIVLYITAFAVIMGIVLLIKGLQNNAYSNLGKVMIFTLLSFVVLVGSSGLFEFVYEMEFSEIKLETTSDYQYIFLIDDSGSMYMSGGDRSGKRFDAVEKAVNNLGTNDFAVYIFWNETECVTPMGSEKAKSYRIDDFADRDLTDNMDFSDIECRLTMMMGAITDSLDDIDASAKPTKIIILTDGIPNDENEYRQAVMKCNRNDVSVSTVGFGNTDEGILTRLANDTGGEFVYANDINNIIGDLETIVVSDDGDEVNRDLLGYRNDSKANNWLYALMRIGFLILLGVVWSIMKQLLIGEMKYTKISLIMSIVLCSAAAILCELLTLIGLNGIFIRMIFCALWACSFVPSMIYMGQGFDSDTLHSARTGGNSLDSANDLGIDTSGKGGGPKSFI